MRSGTAGRLVRVVAVALVAAMALAGCAARVERPPPGSHLTVLAVWSGTEQQRFSAVLDAFSRESGVTVDYRSSGQEDLAVVLAAYRRAGRLPDVVLFPQPELLRQYARDGLLVPLGDIVGAAVARNYAPVWTRLGSEGGRLYGVWFKAANKSSIWYDVSEFERAGVVPPGDLTTLFTVAARIRAGGQAAFAVAGNDPWTLTDLFENLYLRTAGGRRYDLLAEHQLPWTDATVRQALDLFTRLLRPDVTAGRGANWRRSSFEASVSQVFGPRRGAAMVAEGDFTAAAITASTGSELGLDADVFPFPGPAGSGATAAGADQGSAGQAVPAKAVPAKASSAAVTRQR